MAFPMNPQKEALIPQVLADLETTPKQTLAKQLAKERPELFKSAETARAWIRAITGSMGDPTGKTQPRVQMKSSIAEGIAKLKAQPPEYDPLIEMPKGKTLVLSDIHIPHHDAEALTIAIEAGLAHGCEDVILNGDIVDFYGISRYTREIGRMTLAEELEQLRQFLSLIRDAFPGKKVYKLGNHEDRLRAYLLRECKELADMPELTYENLFGASGFEIVNKNPIQCGKLKVLHGHEFGESVFSPVNPAKGLFNRAKSSAIIGHHHQTSHHSEGNLNGDRIGCWSLGCLCSMTPEYRPFAFTRWNHGFAMVDVEEDGSFRVHNRTIIGGEVF